MLKHSTGHTVGTQQLNKNVNKQMPIWWGCYLNGLMHQAWRPLRSWDYSHSPQGSPETTSMGSRHSPEVVTLVIIRYGTSARNFEDVLNLCVTYHKASWEKSVSHVNG